MVHYQVFLQIAIAVVRCMAPHTHIVVGVDREHLVCRESFVAGGRRASPLEGGELRRWRVESFKFVAGGWRASNSSLEGGELQVRRWRVESFKFVAGGWRASNSPLEGGERRRLRVESVAA
jgi:hypothetical protein